MRFVGAVGIGHGFAARSHPRVIQGLCSFGHGGAARDRRAGDAVAFRLKRKRGGVTVAAVVARAADHDDVRRRLHAVGNNACYGVARTAHQFAFAQNAGVAFFKGSKVVKIKNLLAHGINISSQRNGPPRPVN